MAVKTFLKSSGLAALAAGAAVIALPATASARPDGDQEGHGRWSRGGDAAAPAQAAPEQHNGGGGGWRQRSEAAPAPAPVAAPAAQAEVRQHAWGGGGGGGWQQRSQAAPAPQAPRQYEQRNWGGWRQRSEAAPAPQAPQQRAWNGGWQQRQQAVPQQVQPDQRTWRNGGDRQGWNGGDRQRWNGGQPAYRNTTPNYAYRQGYAGTTPRWNNAWRNDQRYNWSAYRNTHRDIFRGGRYYAPYQNWSYRRFGIGIVLDPLFYSDQYWLDDPYMYRLPEVDGPYRWVRYYDDVLLVDIYTGEVVDVIYDFFD